MKESKHAALILGRTGNKIQALRQYQENLNSDNTIIAADRNCSICYGCGTMLVRRQPDRKHSSINNTSNFSFIKKTCTCIIRKRELLARKKHSAIYRDA